MDAQDSTNMNVNWLDSKGVWVFYTLLVAGFRALLYVLPASVVAWPAAWTITHVLHGVVQFVGLHWNQGTPMTDVDQGEYNDLTFWEQLDGGVPWTPNKKFLLMVPVVLFMITCHATEYTWSYFILNFPIFLLVVVSKLPEMHKVRVFGVNRKLD